MHFFIFGIDSPVATSRLNVYRSPLLYIDDLIIEHKLPFATDNKVDLLFTFMNAQLFLLLLRR